MKTLFVIRHAHTPAGAPGLPDIKRTLSQNGRTDAALTGRTLSEDVFPDQILCSAAIRTRETAEIIRETLDLSSDKLVFSQEIYEASIQNLLSALSKTDDAIQQLYMIGHNPGVTELIMQLTQQFVSFSPACVAKVQLSIDSWKDIAQAQGELLYFRCP